MSTLIPSNALAGESGHYYTRDGQPAYEVTGKNGKTRAANIKDAREHLLLPGCTSIISCQNKPGLVRYFKYSVLWSALTLTRQDGESDDAYIARIIADSEAAAKIAADVGTAIHAAIEQTYNGLPCAPEWLPWSTLARDTVEANCGPQEWLAERSYAHHAGYGCKVDLHSTEWLLDFKTTDGPLDDKKTWDEHAQQLAANRRAAGIHGARCAIVYVRRDQPEAKFLEVPEHELERGLECFDALLAYWQAKNKYVSAWQPLGIAA